MLRRRKAGDVRRPWRAGPALRRTGDFSAARAPLEESVRLGRELGNKQRLADALLNYGRTAYQAGEYGVARRQLQESMAFFAENGNVHFSNASRSGLAEVAWREGDMDRALSLYRETLLVWRRLGNRRAVARILECLAFAIAGQAREASRWWTSAEPHGCWARRKRCERTAALR